MRIMRMLESTQYQPALITRFELVRQRMSALLPEARVEHIGSSAIPGAISKGDLDVCVLVPASEHHRAVMALTRHGYVEKSGTLRTDALCMLEWHEPGHKHAVQVVATGSEFEKMFITFRDSLRQNPDLVARYNQVKEAAAHLGESAYRSAKSRFIDEVLIR